MKIILPRFKGFIFPIRELKDVPNFHSPKPYCGTYASPEGGKLLVCKERLKKTAFPGLLQFTD